MDNIILELKDLRKSYGEKIKYEVLKGIDLNVYKAEFTSIIGPSGSGKSTLLNILGALDIPTSGSYMVDGIKIENLTQNQLADLRNNKFGFIFQFHHLLPEFTALENVLMPTLIRYGKADTNTTERALKYLDMVGVLNKKNNMANNLSGGQQQRVAIARAMVNEPLVVFADEPTGNLDSESAKQVYCLMRELNQQLKTTFIIVTHDPKISSNCDRTIEILDGKITSDVKNEVEIVCPTFL